MKALKASCEEKALRQRYIRQLDSQEDRLSALQNEISHLHLRRGEADQHLAAVIQALGGDESFCVRW